jgi:peptide/nickel transport system permease protein
MVLPAGLLHRAGTIRDWSGRLISLTRQNAARARRRRGRMSIARLRHSAVLWRAGVRRSINPLLVGGLAILLLLLVASFVVPAISPFGPDQLNLEGALKAPSGTHPFGTDSSGFDLFVRVFYAARLDLGIALLGVVIGLVIGGLVGLFVGFSDGLISEFIMRIIDVVQAFPPLILAIALVALTGNKLINLAYVIGFLNIPVFLRLIRGQVLVIREQRYIDVARALGNPRWRIMLRHVLPNAAGPAIVQFGLSAGYAVLIIAGIAFLGIGIHPPTAEWGSLILDGSQYVTSGQWWLFLFPGVALAIAVAGFNMVAEGVERAREVARA